jgi:hypothetical protein
MKRILVAALFVLVIGPGLYGQQNPPTPGIYQITGGTYTECCGIIGPAIGPLPDASQTFVQLIIDEGKAELLFLGSDMRTVHRTSLLTPTFRYALTNGTVHGGWIRFESYYDSGLLLPDYTVAFSPDSLHINGRKDARWGGYATHSNVTARLMPVAVLRTSEVEICWESFAGRMYQVQYRSALTTNAWTNLGDPIPGTGATICVADRVPADEPRRFYRVETLPEPAAPPGE